LRGLSGRSGGCCGSGERRSAGRTRP
jgi:hypothetical protein